MPPNEVNETIYSHLNTHYVTIAQKVTSKIQEWIWLEFSFGDRGRVTSFHGGETLAFLVVLLEFQKPEPVGMRLDGNSEKRGINNDIEKIGMLHFIR